MSTLANILFLAALASMVIVYPMYFIELHAFWKIMARDHPELVGQPDPNLGDAYKLLQRVKSGRIGTLQLSPQAAISHSSAKRLLYIGASLFMVVLFMGVTDAVLAKNVGRA
ncbi:MAG: hypothetical protein EOP50_00845 [Sphingobacteriales bacterium]|nr:MAG: hypothetical protein EOP50_00845 [Sphingobacteriales bacterium]